MMRASYRCRNCGKRFYRDTRITADKNPMGILASVIYEGNNFNGDIPAETLHQCDKDKVGIARLIGLNAENKSWGDIDH